MKFLTASIIVALLAFAPLNAFAQKNIRQTETVNVTKNNDDVKEIQIPEGSLQKVSEMPLGVASVFAPNSPSAADPTSVYSNITTFSGQGYANGGAAADPSNGANTVTKMVADDLTLISVAPYNITGLRFSVANFNSTAVSARPLLRFYQADGTSGGPGTFITQLNFNPISFAAGNVATFTYNPAVTIFTLSSNKVWVGMVFDNNAGATGATAAQLNNLGQGLFNPPNRGTSADLFFATTSNGQFTTSNPAGGFLFFGGSPVANFGWELLTPSVVPTAAGVNISGRVVTADGRAIYKAVLTLTAADGSAHTALTNPFGYYRFSDIPAGATYILGVSDKTHVFDQPTRVINLVDNVSDFDFIANP